MEKHVEPLVTNSEEERSFVSKIAIFGGVVLVAAGGVAFLKSCEHDIDQKMNRSMGDSLHKQITGIDKPQTESNYESKKGILSIEQPFLYINKPK